MSPTVLRTSAVALWLVAIGVVAAAVGMPYSTPTIAVTDVPAARPATVPVITFDDLTDLNLRRPLVDAPATMPSVVAAPVVPDVRLAGIVAEPGHSFAVFRTPAGTTEVRTVGQLTGGAEVVAITPTTVTIRFAGRTSTLHLPMANNRLEVRKH